MKITKLSIRDFLGISVFKVDKLGKFNRITGGNGVGKSTILKAITGAFKSSGVDPNLIKTDAEKAEILIELDDSILVERTLTPSSNKAKVVVDGQPKASPQKWLNSIIGPMTFNPIAFFLGKPKQRRDQLIASIPFTLEPETLEDELEDIPDLDLMEYDYSRHGLVVLEEIKKDVYKRRHEQNLEVTRLKKSIEQDKLDMPETFDPERFKGFDFDALMRALMDAKDTISKHDQDCQMIGNLRERGKRILDEFEQLENKIKSLKAELVNLQATGGTLKARIESFERPDIESLQATIDEYQKSQKLILKLEEIERKGDDVYNADELHLALDTLYRRLSDEIPRKLLAQIKLPVDNLQIEGDNILIDGVSLDTLSTSEQIKFAAKYALSTVGDLKVICIDGFEGLDWDSREGFQKETADDGVEYFTTEVTNGGLQLETEGDGTKKT